MHCAIHIISPSLTGRERCHEVTERVGLEGAGGWGKMKKNDFVYVLP